MVSAAGSSLASGNLNRMSILTCQALKLSRSLEIFCDWIKHLWRVGIKLRIKQKCSCNIKQKSSKGNFVLRVKFVFNKIKKLFFFFTIGRTACLYEVLIPVLQFGFWDITWDITAVVCFLTRRRQGGCSLLLVCLVTLVLWELFSSQLPC